MSHGARAVASFAALTGFLAVAGLQLALVLLALWVLLGLLPSEVALRVGVPLSLATFGTLAYATWRALHTRRRTPAGVVVTRSDAPRLWELVDGAAAAVGVAPPDTVTVVADAAATLGERTRLLGLLGGRRELYLGLPLLQAWDEPRLTAVVTHELAHGSPAAGRLAPVAYRGRVAVGRIVPRLSRRNPAGAVLRAYAAFYRRVDEPFSRAHEFAADRAAAEHAGVAPTVAALRELPALAAMQRLFHAEYLGPGWQAGHVPDDVFGGFLRVLAARADEVSLLRAREPAPAGEGDTHPPLAERLAALGSPPAAAGEAAEERTPEELVPDLPALGRALQAVAFPPHGRTVVGWDEFLSVARTAEMEREAQAALATLERAVGAPVPDTAAALDLAADGRLRAAAATVFPGLGEHETMERVVDLLTLLLALAALHAGVARWRHSWTGAAELLTADGAPLDLASPAAAAADPETAAAAREHLRGLGIALDSVGAPSPRPETLGGLVNLAVDGARTDLLITDLGLLLVPSLPRGRSAEAKQRLARLAAEGIGITPAQGRFVPFADVTGVTESAGRRRGWMLELRDGASLTVRPGLDSDEAPGGWAAWADTVAFLAGTRTGA